MEKEEMACWKRDILPLLPERLREMLSYIEDSLALEELRIRAGQPLQICFNGRDRLIYAPGGRPAASEKDCAEIISRITEHSLYAWEDELRNGFLTIPGGYRVGLSGRVIKEAGRIARITDFTALNIRIARDCVGCSDTLLGSILKRDGTPFATLIISPPGCGKTTMLRDLARQFSYGNPCHENPYHGIPYPAGFGHGMRVCIVDERMELAGSVRGVSQYDVGPRTDVLSGCNKPEGIRLAVRVLSPGILITDELGSKEDADAVQEAAFSGVTTIASAHVSDIEALKKRLSLVGLLYSGAFERIVLLGRDGPHVGVIHGVYDEELMPVHETGGSVLCFER